MPKDVVIAGGGLSGLALGLLLRREGVPVTIIEAGEYPRHRVCGEFISGRGLDVLDRIGLLEEVKKAGGRLAGTVLLFAESERTIEFELPRPACCISRYRLDALLARQFEALGGILKTKPAGKISVPTKGSFELLVGGPPNRGGGPGDGLGLKCIVEMSH